MDDQAPYSPCSVEEVLRDYKSRRTAMVKALTTEVEDFFAECDPAKDNLCLYGFPDESWKVSIPAEEVPPELPEPALGINFARDGMERKDWLSLVAVHSDSWLMAVAFYYGARLDNADRKRLFDGMNDAPTLFEIVTGRAKEKPSGRSKKQQQQQQKEAPKRTPKKEEEEDEYEEDDDDEHGDTYCGLCGEPYSKNQFWIACDICQKWYHGSCVKMTAAKAANVEEYKCPPCSSNKRSRGA